MDKKSKRRASFGSSRGSSSNVQVYCRVRPMNEMERDRERLLSSVVTVTPPDTIVLTEEDNNHPFTFDYVFDEESTQESLFNRIALPVIHEVIKGYNGTIFTYGQTASGKTYTMEGTNDSGTAGIIPRSAIALFELIRKSEVNLEFFISVSYIEIYMERIRDLLGKFFFFTFWNK